MCVREEKNAYLCCEQQIQNLMCNYFGWGPGPITLWLFEKVFAKIEKTSWYKKAMDSRKYDWEKDRLEEKVRFYLILFVWFAVSIAFYFILLLLIDLVPKIIALFR